MKGGDRSWEGGKRRVETARDKREEAVKPCKDKHLANSNISGREKGGGGGAGLQLPCV